MNIQKVIDALEQFAPLPLQEDYDNAGLQVGLTGVEVSGALLCLDVTEEIVDEAIRKGCNLIVSHHPIIFRKLRRVTDEDYVQRAVRKAVKNDIAIVSMHTNLDAAQGGVNFKIAEKLGLENPDFLGKLQEVNGVESVCCNQLLRRPIKKVAVCGGAGSFLLEEAIAAGVDAFITGEMSYHEYFGHEQEIQICVIGHYQSEQYVTEVFQSIIQKACPEVRCEIAETNTNPIIYL